MAALDVLPLKVLVVEDSTDDVKLMLRSLRAGGFDPVHKRVQTAAAFSAALVDERWDAVLSDYAMPGFTGLDALRIFRAAGIDVPFILISGTIGEAFAADAMKAGASDYVMKMNLARLAPALRRELIEAATRAELRAAHEALGVSEKQFRQMADNIGDVFYLVEAATGRILFVNKAYEAIWGRGIASLVGQPWTDAVHPIDRASVLDENPTGKFEHQYRILRPDGTIRWIESTGFPVRDEAGKVVRIAGIAKDVTERRKAAEALRESEARFRSLTALSSDWFWEQDAEFRFVRFSGGGQPDDGEGWDKGLSSAIGLRRWELPGLMLASGTWEEHKALLEAHKPFRNFAYRRLIEDGTFQYAEVSGEPGFDAGGRFTGYRGVGTDITERTRAQHELQRFRAAMDISPDAIVLVDRARMRYIDVNQTTCDMAGLSRQQLLAMTPMDLTGQTREALEREYDTLIADNQSPASRVEGQGPGKDGAIVCVETRRRALRTETGWVIVGTARDITERKEAETKITRLNRVYAMMSGINSAIVRIKGREELFAEACRIAVSEGGFVVARFVELGADGMARVASSSNANAPEYQPLVDEYNLDPEHCASPLAQALRSGQLFMSNDVAGDSRVPNRVELARNGNYSLALLPLIVGTRVAGVLALRAREAGMFNDDELNLLKELVGNIALALERIEQEERLTLLGLEQKRGDEALRRFSGAMDATTDAIFMVDRASLRYIYVNEIACRMQERSREELFALGPEQVLNMARADLEAMYDVMISTGKPAEPYELLRKRKDGSEFWVEVRRYAHPSENGWTIITLSRDITQQKERDENLRRFRAALDVSGDAILLIDRASMRYIDVNQTLCDMTGLTRQELIGRTAMEVFGADRATLEHDYDSIIADGKKSTASLVVGQYRHTDGSVTPVESRRGALPTQDGWIIVGTARDIRERMASEAQITHLNRVYAVLSGINTLIVRVSDREELFREACRVAVEKGGFRVAWIGMVDPLSMKLVPVASVGDDVGLLAALDKDFSLEGGAQVRGTLAVRAIAEKRPLISNDTQSDPRVAHGGKHVEAGIHSMAMLPLIVSGEAVGVLGLYAGEIDFFHAEELKLLTELAGDVAFAIDHIEKQARLDYLAYYDVLTGLANRRLFLERLAQHMRSAAGGGHKLAVFFIDLERFKNINESLGRPAGDALLRQVADWLTAGGGDANLLARVGADQFAVVMPKVAVDGDVTRFLDNRIQSFRDHQFSLDDASFRIAIKVGVAVYPDDGDEADTLLRNAEAALKKAKERGDRYLFYKQKMTARGLGKLTLENKLRRALENEEYVLHYQPKISLQTGKMTGAEALIRWNDPATGLVPPGHFIPILEETGLIHDVGRWALHKAIADYLRWKSAGLPAVRIAVNVSPLQLRDRGFIAEVERAVGIDPGAPGGLELEITESLIMEDVKHNIAVLQAIGDMKVTIAIDDFGTGFSSLSYLSKLPVDTLKIDRSFVIDMTGGPDGLSLVSTIINLAHAFKLKVVAEGVETEEQSRLLRLLNCNEMQGYLFCRPVPADDFEAKFLLAPPAEKPAEST